MHREVQKINLILMQHIIDERTEAALTEESEALKSALSEMEILLNMERKSKTDVQTELDAVNKANMKKEDADNLQYEMARIRMMASETEDSLRQEIQNITADLEKSNDKLKESDKKMREENFFLEETVRRLNTEKDVLSSKLEQTEKGAKVQLEKQNESSQAEVDREKDKMKIQAEEYEQHKIAADEQIAELKIRSEEFTAQIDDLREESVSRMREISQLQEKLNAQRGQSQDRDRVMVGQVEIMKLESEKINSKLAEAERTVRFFARL